MVAKLGWLLAYPKGKEKKLSLSKGRSSGAKLGGRKKKNTFYFA